MVASRNDQKTNVTIEYNPPQVIELIEKASAQVRADYKRSNPSRLELILLLEIVHKQKMQCSDAERRDVYLGAWIYCMEVIANEYRVANPSFKDGYVFNYGSTLYKILSTHLGIDKDHQLSEKDKLKYLCKFYNSVYSQKQLTIPQSSNVKEQLIGMMRAIFANEHDEQERILQAIPTEKSIDFGMSKLLQDYVSNSKEINPERVVLAKLAVAICRNNPCEDTSNRDELNLLPRSLRIKIGMLMYIMDSINDSYLIRKPKENSVLYDLCDNILGNSYSHIDNQTKKACLTALELYLKDENNRNVLEYDINKQPLPKGCVAQAGYIDPLLRPVLQHLDKMIKKVAPGENKLPISNVTLTAGIIGAILGSASGYGAGDAIGFGVSLTDQASFQKSKLSGATGLAMKKMLGMTNCYYGFYAADVLVTKGYGRIFAKIFEVLGAILGAAGVGGLSFVVYDVSLTTAYQLWKLCLHLNKDLQKDMIKESDVSYVTTLLSLPPEILSEMDKDKFRKVCDVDVSKTGLGLLSKSVLKSTSLEEDNAPRAMKRL